MNKNEAENLLRGAIKENLKSIGFREVGTLFYTKDCNDLLYTLGVGGILNKTGGYEFGYVAGIRFEKIEELLEPDEDSKSKPTIIVPHHFFEEGHVYYQWSFSNTTELAVSAKAMSEHVMMYAGPFWENVTSVNDLNERMEDNAFVQKLVLDSTQTVCLKAAVLFVNNHQVESMEMLQMVLSERKNDLPKRRRPLERLIEAMKRVIER